MNAINPERLASQPYQGNSDVFVLLNSTADEESTYDLMKSTPFTEEKKQKLYNISGVKDVYELYMLDGILTNSEGEKFELSIENAVNPETFKNEIVEGMQPSHELQNGAIPVAINRQSPYYQKLNMQLQVGDYLPYIIDTGYGQKEVELVVSGFVENSDTGLVIYTSGENMKSLSEMNCTLAWYICLDDNGKDVATEIIKEIFIDDDRVDVSVWLMMLWHWKITSIMRKSSLQFWWCLLVCFIYKYAEYQHYKCHCQKTRLCTTGSYRYDKIAVAKSTAVGKFHLFGWKFYRKLHFRHTNRIAALYPNIKNSRTFIL